MLNGKKITLVPAQLSQREDVYNWCFHSETSHAHVFENTEVPTYAEFCEDYCDYYFDGTRPLDGRGFIIMLGDEAIGFLSYAAFHLQPGWVELDNWLACEAHCGKGYGSDALKTLGRYLADELGFARAIMRPSHENPRAIAAYEKAGFAQSDLSPEAYLLPEHMEDYADGDYGEGGDVLLVWQLG
ncbi:MAG: GNAT family N-acetyltransferase [Oscillospiraceae bacterium]|nr:GNAT family N-acetyltransferase [Oscillospiraceae bacterium]